jgi:hypothetical protein
MWDRRDVALAGLAAFTSVALRPLPTVFQRSLWTDETWVTVLTRVTLTRTWGHTASSPIGWLALLRLVPGSSPERFRVLTLAFAVVGFPPLTGHVGYAAWSVWA